MEKEISYNCTITYSTLNKITGSTKTIWFVCHGMGHLSRYFIKNFEKLNPQENYIIAPQAQSKYYLPTKKKRVGASWLTQENTLKETANVYNYFDAIFKNESIPDDVVINFLGYSQGVSVAMRYAASRKIALKNLILVSGGIPTELEKNDFEYLKNHSKIYFIYGNEDEYLNASRIKSETEKLHSLFCNKVKICQFKGTHDFNSEAVFNIIN